MNVQELLYERPTAKWRTDVETEHSLQLSSSGLVGMMEVVDILVPHREDWQSVLRRQLQELLELEPGWDGPRSGPISRAMARYTEAILRSAMATETPPPALVPAHGGALQLEWHEGGLDVELMIYRPLDAELTVNYHDGRNPIEEQSLATDFDILSGVLQELAGRGRVHAAA